MQRSAIFAALVLSVVALVHGQTRDESEKSELRLRLEPGEMRDGVPQAFTFQIVNDTDHEVRLPMPSVQCSNGFEGRVGLSVRFRPVDPSALSTEGGCALDFGGPFPAILDRIKTWKILQAGESLSIEADRAHLYYDGKAAGEYEFWATYEPPYISDQDRKLLEQAGIYIVHSALTSRHLTFKKLAKP